MKINNAGLNPTQSSRANSTESVENNAKVDRRGGYKTDKSDKDAAAVSEKARLLSKTHEAMKDTAEIRQGLVEEIRTKLQDGTYDVSVGDLAKKLLDRFQ